MTYKLQDLIDIERFNNLQNRPDGFYSFPSAIIDNDGNILTAIAGQDICTHFHKQNKDSAKLCIQSDQCIQRDLHKADPDVSYCCHLGLKYRVMPIVIKGVQYGNYFFGQFFEKEPDMDFFKAQAGKYSFNEKDYLAAVKRVPILTQKQLDSYLLFIRELITIICENALKKLKGKESRALLEDTEDYRRLILQVAKDGFWATDQDAKITEVNDSYCRMSGYSRDELLGRRIADLDEGLAAEILLAQEKNGPGKGSVCLITRHCRKDGTFFDVEISARCRAGREGQIVYFIRDITHFKAINTALRESEINYRQLFESISDAVIVTDENQTIISCNPALIKIFGYTPEEVAGKQTTLFYDNKDHYEVMEKMIQKANADSHISYTINYKKKSGEVFPGETKIFPLKNTRKKRLGFISFTKDITYQKKIEGSLQDTNSELKRKRDELEEINTALTILLKKREQDKQEIEEKIYSNYKTVILPFFNNLRNSLSNENQQQLADILEKCLKEFISPFAKKLTDPLIQLSPTEIQIASMIKQGLTNKEMAQALNCSIRTIESHRANIRKRLDLKNRKINMKSYFLNLSEP